MLLLSLLHSSNLVSVNCVVHCKHEGGVVSIIAVSWPLLYELSSGFYHSAEPLYLLGHNFREDVVTLDGLEQQQPASNGDAAHAQSPSPGEL